MCNSPKVVSQGVPVNTGYSILVFKRGHFLFTSFSKQATQRETLILSYLWVPRLRALVLNAQKVTVLSKSTYHHLSSKNLAQFSPT